MKKQLIKFLVICGTVALASTWFFWHEISAMAIDGAKSIFSDQVELTWLSEADTRLINGYRLVQKRQDVARVAIENLRVGSVVGNRVDLSLRLVGKGGVDFPWLRVFLMDGNDRTMRTIELSPSDYGHGDSFAAEEVTIRVALKAGEERFTVAPFYRE